MTLAQPLPPPLLKMWRRPAVGTLLWVGLAVVIAVASFGTVVGLLLQASGWTAFHQASGSMLPTLLISDHFFVDRDAYDEGRRPQRGDIIVFAAPARAPAAAVRNALNALWSAGCRTPTSSAGPIASTGRALSALVASAWP
jgi:hypothetical protein